VLDVYRVYRPYSREPLLRWCVNAAVLRLAIFRGTEHVPILYASMKDRGLFQSGNLIPRIVHVFTHIDGGLGNLNRFAAIKENFKLTKFHDIASILRQILNIRRKTGIPHFKAKNVRWRSTHIRDPPQPIQQVFASENLGRGERYSILVIPASVRALTSAGT
jgi:hypothetical protein